MEKVKVYFMICGDYCAFHEMSFRVVYDVTNNIQLDDDYTLEMLENWNKDEHDYDDVQLCNAIKDGNTYYVDANS